MLASIKRSKRQIAYSGVIAFSIFVLPLILDVIGVETINLFILPFLLYRMTSVGIAIAVLAQIITFLIVWIVFFVVALLFKNTRRILKN